MGPLDAIADWPVDHAAAAVISDGDRRTAGPTERVFDLASVTKLLSAYAALVAIEEGTLDLDEPAGPPGSTVRHLLAHASGLGFDTGVLVAPERKRIYSNTGFEVLGDHLAGRAGMAFGRYVHEAVIEPLAMGATDLGDRSPAHGARSSVEDLARFAAELLAPRLIAEETLAARDHGAVPRPRRRAARLRGPAPERLGPRLRAARPQGTPLDRRRLLGRHLRALRRGRHVPVGGPRCRCGARSP